MTHYIGFCAPHSSGLTSAQVIVKLPDGTWTGVGGHLSSNQSYAEYDAENIVRKHASKGDTYEWAGQFETQETMDAFQNEHPPAP
jgi:hypothetical protein